MKQDSEDGVISVFKFLNVAFHTETSHLIYKANQLTAFYIKYTGMKWVI